MTNQEKADALFRNNKVMLAPMVRASSTPLRTLSLEYGADLVYSEEIIDRSITTCDRLENEKLGTVDYIRKASYLSVKQRRRMAECDTSIILRIAREEKGKFIYQMGTGNSQFALNSALHVIRDIDGLDINMGCPRSFSVDGGMGSALLSDLPQACDIIKTLARNLDKPVSAKIRLLKTPHETLHFCQSLEKAGVNAIAIHARFVGDDTALVPAKSDHWTPIVEDLQSKIPIILNGDLYTKQDIKEMKAKTGATSVMLARPALYNPSIFSDEPILDRTKVIQEYIRHALKWETNYKNIKYVICEMMNSRRHIQHRVKQFPQMFPAGQTIAKNCACYSMKDICRLWDVSNQTFTSQTLSDDYVYSDDYFLNRDDFLQKKKQWK